jgi:hypothetical protein
VKDENTICITDNRRPFSGQLRNGEQDDIDGKQANYCEMRQIHIESGGEYGWPRMDGYGECK